MIHPRRQARVNAKKNEAATAAASNLASLPGNPPKNPQLRPASTEIEPAGENTKTTVAWHVFDPRPSA